MTTTVKAGTPAQLLSLVPSLLGYIPSDSLVVVPFLGSRSLGAVRLNLPSDGEVARDAAMAALGIVIKCGGDALASVVYASGSEAAQKAALVEAELWVQSLNAGIGTKGSFLVNEIGWAASDGAIGLIDELAYDPALKPGPVPPLPEGIEGVMVTEERPTPEDAVALATAVSLGELGTHPDALSLWAELIDSPSVRDIALGTICYGVLAGDGFVAAQRGWEAGEGYPTDLAQFMWGDGARPNHHALENALRTTLLVAASLKGKPAQWGSLTTASWLAWALGKSSEAEHYAKQALELEPGGLAEIVLAFVNSGHLPSWAFPAGGAL